MAVIRGNNLARMSRSRQISRNHVNVPLALSFEKSLQPTLETDCRQEHDVGAMKPPREGRSKNRTAIFDDQNSDAFPSLLF